MKWFRPLIALCMVGLVGQSTLAMPVGLRIAMMGRMAIRTQSANGDGTEQELKPKLVGTGTVTVPKTWKTGQNVTWKAKTDKGSVFAHWEGPLVDSLGLSRNELRNPSLAFAVPDGFETNQLTAVFIPIDDDGLSKIAITQTEFELKAAVDGVQVTDDSESYLTASVSGLPSGLKFDAKTLRITGAPTKGGVFWVQLKGKNASGYQWAENIKITVSGGGAEAKEPKLTRTAYHPVTVICATDGGTVSGTGVYAEGKKAAIKATAAKGYVFAGWYEDSRLTTPATFEKGDFRTASQSVVVPEMRYVFARFVTTEEDKANVALAVDGAEMEAVGAGYPPYRTNVMCGVYMEWPVAVEALSLPTVTVSGLPTGLKFTAKPVTSKVGSGKAAVVVTNVPANTIYGTPTAASKARRDGGIAPYQVKVTVTTAGKSKVVYEIDVTVDAVKEWAVGKFDGGVGGTGNGEPGTGGLVTLTVNATGKVSGKLLEGGKTWTLSAANFDAYDAEDGVYTATVLGKSGKEAVTNEVMIVAETVEAVTGDDAPYQRGVARGDGWTAWRNPWKDEPWKTDAKPFAKAPLLVVGEVTLKFAASGAVTASGKFVTGKDAKGKDIVYSASCSSVLVHAGGNAYTVYLYFPPKAGKFEGYAAEISLFWDGVEFLGGRPQQHGGELGGVQLWENGPYWAECNVGASKPEEYGYYFWWGDTIGYKWENDQWVASDGSASNFSFSDENAQIQTYGKDVAALLGEGWIVNEDGTNVLAREHDAAQAHWGDDWRMPTKQEQQDLVDKCNWTWTTMNGVDGYEVRGKGDYDANSIFIPCAGCGLGTSFNYVGSCGCFWSSDPDSDEYHSWSFFFNSGDHSTGSDYRVHGFSVRPVQAAE